MGMSYCHNQNACNCEHSIVVPVASTGFSTCISCKSDVNPGLNSKFVVVDPPFNGGYPELDLIIDKIRKGKLEILSGKEWMNR